MRILAQEEYGLRCILQLARHGGSEPLTVAEIAEAEGLSREYAGKLMQLLRRAGLVTSARGPGGGYLLARPSADISIWEVVEVLGGRLFPSDFCACHPGQAKQCVHASDCSIRALWQPGWKQAKGLNSHGFLPIRAEAGGEVMRLERRCGRTER